MTIKKIFILFIIFVSQFFGQQKNENEDFQNFIVMFFALEELQKERTVFPLEYCYYEDYPEKTKTTFITEENWKPLVDSIYVKSHYFRNIYDNFGHKMRDTGERVFAYEGNETGTAIYYYFALRDNKWFLIKKEDFSD